MKIESIIKRDPPTFVQLGDTSYQFKPDDQGRHVVDVTDKHHIAKFLSITEGYQLVDADEGSLPKAVKTELKKEIGERTKQPVLEPVDENVLKGSTVHPATFDIDGEQVSIEDVIFHAHEMSGMTTAEWNGLPDEARHDLIDAALDAMSGEQEEDPANPETPPASSQQPEAGGDMVPAKSPVTPESSAQDVTPEALREAAAQEYKAKFGKLPHYKWTIEKIREELAKPADEGK